MTYPVRASKGRTIKKVIKSSSSRMGSEQRTHRNVCLLAKANSNMTRHAWRSRAGADHSVCTFSFFLRLFEPDEDREPR